MNVELLSSYFVVGDVVLAYR